MDLDVVGLLKKFLFTHKGSFSAEDVRDYLKSNQEKAYLEDIDRFLSESDYVIPLIDKKYITRISVFTNQYFSFKPTLEEIKKGHFLIGHRCIPFINQEIPPDRIIVTNGDEDVPSKKNSFSMNLALDVFGLYGEGYVLPYIYNDHSNEEYPLTSVNYSLPVKISLTSWPFDKLKGGSDIVYGDRILCRVTDWISNKVEMSVLKSSDKNTLSKFDLERNEWFKICEERLIDSFDKNGPCLSIEQQLAFLYLENIEELCTESCGSIEELLANSNKISFSHYGVESRLWKKNELIPFIGNWNTDNSSEMIYSNMFTVFSPLIFDAYIKDSLEQEQTGKPFKSIEDIMNLLFPPHLKINSSERRYLLLNIQKRHDILKKSFDRTQESSILSMRHRIVELFSDVSDLLSSIGASGLKMDVFPQQELIILMQLFVHLVRIIEEIEFFLGTKGSPIEEIALSLEGMEDTFEEIGDTLSKALDSNLYKNFKIIEEKNGF